LGLVLKGIEQLDYIGMALDEFEDRDFSVGEVQRLIENQKYIGNNEYVVGTYIGVRFLHLLDSYHLP
jgi:hypothetical protein